MSNYIIQLITIKSKKSYFFEFTKNVHIGDVLKYVSDYFQIDNIRYFYKSVEIFKDNDNILVQDIDCEIYFLNS